MPLRNRNILIAIAGSVLVTIGILYLYSAWKYKKIRKDIAEAQTTVAALNQKLETTKARARQLDQMQREMARLQIEVADLEKQLPKNRELPALLRVVTHQAESFGLILGTVAPGPKADKGLYEEILYTLTVTASFHSLAHFLTKLGQGERLFAARNLVLSPASIKTDPTKTVNATFQLIAFKYHG